MNETTRLVLKILATVALVVIVYMAFSYLAAAVIGVVGRARSRPARVRRGVPGHYAAREEHPWRKGLRRCTS